MSLPNEIHVHIPVGYQGVVHLHVGSDTNTDAAEQQLEPVTVSSDVEQMLKRFENFDPTTQARKAHDALVATGWTVLAPRSRDGSKNKNTYLRFVYIGKRRVVLYLNTTSFISNGAGQREFVSRLDGVEIHSTDAYLPISDGRLTQTLVAIDALRRWADGAA